MSNLLSSDVVAQEIFKGNFLSMKTISEKNKTLQE